ncbi:MAG: IS66-like element accessory protein TnpA [Roseiarcus sp.]
MSGLDLELERKAAAGRRVEVIRGGDGGRRRWSDNEKAQAIEASLVAGANVSEVARRHGVTPQQLFTWRRQARQLLQASDDAPPFVPAIVAAADQAVVVTQAAGSKPGTPRPHSIELDVEGSSVWIWPGAEPAMVKTIIGALKAGK